MEDSTGMPGGIVTLLFTDLVGSTEILDELGDTGNEPLRRAHARLLRSEIEGHRGRQVKNTGDGVMAAFDAPSDAVACAISVQQAVHLHNRGSGSRPMHVRIGLQLGEVEEDDGDYFGTAVVVASRLCAAAGSGEILASDVVRAVVAARGAFRFEPLGPLTLKGFAEPIDACRISWEPIDAEIDLAARTDGAFVGRARELAALVTAWESARAGHRTLVLVSGEPGIGKTRLIHELAERARIDGGAVLAGRCDEQAPAPFLPFTEAVADHVDESLFLSATPSATPVPGAEDAERYRFYSALTRALQRIAEQGPVLLLLDDLHWADEPTLLLLRHLLRRPELDRVLIVGTYRDTDLSRTHPLAVALGELAREGAQRIDLQGLDVDEVGALLGSDLGASATEVHDETEGNPFFVQEIVRHLAEGGPRAQLPQGIRDVIGRRLSRLPEPTVELLQVAAVVGRDFDVALVADAGKVEEDDAIAGLELAAHARLVDEVPGVLDRFRFAHALVRDALLGEIGTSRRVRLHGRVVDALERLYADDLDPWLLMLAHHANEAAAGGSAPRAARYALAAAGYASHRFGSEEAIRLCSQGLEALEGEPGEQRLRCELLLRRSDARAWSSIVESVTDARAAEAIARELGDPRLVATALIRGFSLGPGDYDAALEEGLKQVLLELPPDDVNLRAPLLGMLSAAAVTGPNRSETFGYSAAALDLAEEADDPDMVALAMYYAGFPMAVNGNVVAADRVLALAAMEEHRQLEIPGRVMRINALMNRGDLDEARGEHASMRDLERTVPVPVLHYAVVAIDATFAAVEGRWDDARMRAREASSIALAIFGDVAGDIGPLTAAIAAFPRLRAQGRSDRLIPGTETAAATMLNSGWQAALAVLLADVGRTDDARVVLARIPPEDFLRPSGLFVDRYTCALAIEAAAMIGDQDALEALYSALSAEADLCVVLTFGPAPLQWLGSSHLYLGMAARVLGRWDAATEHLRAAAELHDRCGAIPLAATTRRQLELVDQRVGGGA
ncbi:MAG TPA: AAA family ATPase [Acidimicrobiales bacterium]|nr:AAA family ATPase [Acidimicrobiales bacterium]